MGQTNLFGCTIFGPTTIAVGQAATARDNLTVVKEYRIVCQVVGKSTECSRTTIGANTSTICYLFRTHANRPIVHLIHEFFALIPFTTELFIMRIKRPNEALIIKLVSQYRKIKVVDKRMIREDSLIGDVCNIGGWCR